MRLDKNVGTGEGKYALVELRKINALCKTKTHEAHTECIQALRVLQKHGVYTSGLENPGQQFFVMKYKDIFTIAGLFGYRQSVESHMRALRRELESPYCTENETKAAEVKAELESITEFFNDLTTELERALAVEPRVLPT